MQRKVETHIAFDRIRQVVNNINFDVYRSCEPRKEAEPRAQFKRNGLALNLSAFLAIRADNSRNSQHLLGGHKSTATYRI